MRGAVAPALAALLPLTVGCDSSFHSRPEPGDEPAPQAEAARDAAAPAAVLQNALFIETEQPWAPQLTLSDRDGEVLLLQRDLPAVARDGKSLVALRTSGKGDTRFSGTEAPLVDLVLYALPSMQPQKVFALRHAKSSAPALAAAVLRANAALQASKWRALQPGDDKHHPTALLGGQAVVDDLRLQVDSLGGLPLLKMSTRDGRVAVEKDISNWLPKSAGKACTPVFVNAAASAEMGALYLDIDWLAAKPSAKCPARAPHYLSWVPIPQ